jgi:hypothetical protein
MPQWIETMTSHPLVLLAAIYGLLHLVHHVRGTRREAGERVGPSPGLAAAGAIIAAYVGLVAWYVVQPAYFDHAEPTIPAVAAAYNAGLPLYPALDAAERYAHIYGPLLFLLHGAALWLLGPSIAASKSVGALAILASLSVAFLVFRGRAGTPAAFRATAVCALIFASFGNVTYWTRSDPLLVLSVATGLYGAQLRSWKWSAFVVGVCTGAAFNLKITGPAYLLPALALAAREHGKRFVIAAAAAAGSIAVTPFLAPGISLLDYRDYIELSSRNGVSWARLRQNVEWSVFLAAPLAISIVAAVRAGSFPAGNTGVVSAAFLALGIISIAAAKPGGGPFHLLPLVSVLAFLVVKTVRAGEAGGTRRVAWAFTLSALILAVPEQILVVRTVAGRNLSSAIADLERFADEHPGRRLAVGYAGISYLPHARTTIVARTGDYLLDAPAVQEHRLSGLPIPAATIRAVEDCRVELWLIPAGAEPFVVPGAYAPDGPPGVFPESFRRAFLAHHVRAGRTGGFDVWECRRAPVRTPAGR